MAYIVKHLDDMRLLHHPCNRIVSRPSATQIPKYYNVLGIDG